ncbi:hypothetical protein EVAR_41469_1 [Eumeta japonica]|uniref:Uncharacterized protein n=1 Tax=Eumeta variegata TaxID=151549 RepID=A0A4C1X0Z4_EUMVA|nr:hypothetical protein EVAR_41469_1 [Eumeta japonica]
MRITRNQSSTPIASDVTCAGGSALTDQTLETNNGGGVVNLENLEAKMASIEVSLGGRRRRGPGGRDLARDLDALRDALADKDSLIQSLKKQLSATLSAARLATQASPGGGARRPPGDSEPELSAEERHALEERAAAVRAELEARRRAIADLRRQLETTHVTDNIDTRIEQAELQYRVGREELELLSLSEQARALTALLQHADARAAAASATLYR